VCDFLVGRERGYWAALERDFISRLVFFCGKDYPFAPSEERRRDTDFELQVRAALTGELPVEPDLDRWFSIWHAPLP
jgi:hypothetical protein